MIFNWIKIYVVKRRSSHDCPYLRKAGDKVIKTGDTGSHFNPAPQQNWWFVFPSRAASYIWTLSSCNWNLPTLRRGIFCFMDTFCWSNLVHDQAASSIKTQKAFFCCFDMHLLIFMNKHWFISSCGSHLDGISTIGKFVTLCFLFFLIFVSTKLVFTDFSTIVGCKR